LHKIFGDSSTEQPASTTGTFSPVNRGMRKLWLELNKFYIFSYKAIIFLQKTAIPKIKAN
jgi:hypothetical protein